MEFPFTGGDLSLPTITLTSHEVAIKIKTNYEVNIST
jgi:hypothetical protein